MFFTSLCMQVNLRKNGSVQNCGQWFFCEKRQVWSLWMVRILFDRKHDSGRPRPSASEIHSSVSFRVWGATKTTEGHTVFALIHTYGEKKANISNFHPPFPSNFLLLTVVFCQAATETCKQPSQQNRGRISRQTITENQLLVAGTKRKWEEWLCQRLSYLGCAKHACRYHAVKSRDADPAHVVNQSSTQSRKKIGHLAGVVGGAGPYIRTYRHFPILVIFFVLFFTITRMVLVSQQKHRYRTRYNLPFRA